MHNEKKASCTMNQSKLNVIASNLIIYLELRYLLVQCTHNILPTFKDCIIVIGKRESLAC